MIWIVRRLILWNIVLFSVSLLALTFSGCSSKDDQNKSKADSNSAENNATVPKSEADMNNQKQTKEAISQGIIKLLQSQREANQSLKDNKKQGNIEEETSNKMTSETVSSADAGDNIVISKEASGLRQGDVVKDAGKAMDDGDPEVRLDMMESLVNRELSNANVLPIVSRALKNDKDERVREAAVKVLAFVNNPESDKLLILALADSDENVRRTVLDVAGGTGG